MYITTTERRFLEGIREHNQGDNAKASMCIRHARLGIQEAESVLTSLVEKGLMTLVANPISDLPVDDMRFRYGRITLTLTESGWQECRNKMIGDRYEAEAKLVWYRRE